MTGPWRVRLDYDFATDSHGVFVGCHSFRDPSECVQGHSNPDDRFWMAEPLRFKQVEPGARGQSLPLFSVTRNDKEDNRSLLQAIVDAAYESGIRPSRYNSYESEVGAIRYHLEDMRSLLKLGPQKK